MENIFAADIPAASTTSAHILRFWKIEQSRNEFTAQVYFLQGNVSFDPIREEYVVPWPVLVILLGLGVAPTYCIRNSFPEIVQWQLRKLRR